MTTRHLACNVCRLWLSTVNTSASDAFTWVDLLSTLLGKRRPLRWCPRGDNAEIYSCPILKWLPTLIAHFVNLINATILHRIRFSLCYTSLCFYPLIIFCLSSLCPDVFVKFYVSELSVCLSGTLIFKCLSVSLFPPEFMPLCLSDLLSCLDAIESGWNSAALNIPSPVKSRVEV